MMDMHYKNMASNCGTEAKITNMTAWTRKKNAMSLKK
jgi:hypothetical protein